MIDSTGIIRGAATAAARHETAPSSEEAEGRKDEFREAMRQDTDEKESAETRRGMGAKEEKNGNAPPFFSGDALLQSLGGSFTPLVTQAVTPVPAQDASVLATELAESILVSTDKTTGGEVRITLKDSILPNTEIILRQEGERLVVQLVSGNSASLDALRLAQNDLRNRLMPLGQDIFVEVLDSRGREGGDSSGHSDGRSRGLDYLSESES